MAQVNDTAPNTEKAKDEGGMRVGKPVYTQVDPKTMDPVPKVTRAGAKKGKDVFIELAARVRAEEAKGEDGGNEEEKKKVLTAMLETVIEEMKLTDTLNLQSSYSIMESNVEMMMTDTICIVNCNTVLWRL